MIREAALADYEDETFQFLGRLVERQVGDEEHKRDDLKDFEDDGGIDPDEDKQFEGGALLASERRAFDPFLYVQHPLKRVNKIGTRVEDLRILRLFRKQMLVDFVLIRLPLIIGPLYCLATDYAHTKLNQLEIQAVEMIVMSVLMMGLQLYIRKTWEAQKLPFKMRDTKANYLFKPLRYPEEMAEYQLLKQDKGFMPDWDRFLPHYMLPEIFLDNKLEELLNIFGRRQCKSCIEFATGTELEDDPKRHRSFPLSPRGEALYRGMEHEFNLVDFQLQDNVYHDAQEPTVMFDSVARDFSDFGVQVFAFDVMNALNRKGGDLINPDLDEGTRKHSRKKQRGRKNKYYQQIDDEDDQEANHKSGSEYDALDGIREEDDEDEDELNRKRQEIEAARLEREREEKAEADRLREEQAKKAQEEENRK